MACVAGASSLLPTVLALCVTLLGVYAVKGPFWATATEMLPAATAAAGIAAINSIGNLVGFVGPFLIGAIKDATGNLARVTAQRLACGQGFVQFSGNDDMALGFNAMGGAGCISVTANVAPKLCAEFQAATLRGDYAAALELQDRLMPLHEAIFLEPGVAGAKYGLSVLGMCSEDVRSPLLPPTERVQEAIRAAMRHAGLIN